MKTLHILRSRPDAKTQKLLAALSAAGDAEQFSLFDGNPDYDRLVGLIFERDLVICWW